MTDQIHGQAIADELGIPGGGGGTTGFLQFLDRLHPSDSGGMTAVRDSPATLQQTQNQDRQISLDATAMADENDMPLLPPGESYEGNIDKARRMAMAGIINPVLPFLIWYIQCVITWLGERTPGITSNLANSMKREAMPTMALPEAHLAFHRKFY